MTVETRLQQEFLLKELQLEKQVQENFVYDLIFGRIGNDSDLFITQV
jgi:carbohydrate diacid regulator